MTETANRLNWMGNGWGQWLITSMAVMGLLVFTAASAKEPIELSQPKVLIVSVAPQFSVVKIQRIWTPFFDRLTVLTGLQFEIRHYPSIPAFEDGFKHGEADLVYLGPYHAVTAKQTQGYIPLWHDTELLSGILVVRQDSPLRTIEQLAGAKIAFPAPNAFGASLYIRALLEQKGIKITPVYVNTNQNVYRSVLVGDTSAGGGVKRTLANESADVQGQLRVLFQTPSVAPHPVVAHPRVPIAIREKILSAVLAMSASADRALMAEVGFGNPVVADYARDYAPLENLGLERFMVEGEAAK